MLNEAIRGPMVVNKCHYFKKYQKNVENYCQESKKKSEFIQVVGSQKVFNIFYENLDMRRPFLQMNSHSTYS